MEFNDECEDTQGRVRQRNDSDDDDDDSAQAWFNSDRYSDYDDHDDVMEGLCHEARGLLLGARDAIEQHIEAVDSLKETVEWFKMPGSANRRKDGMRRILDDPETLIPEGAEGLARHLEGLTGHSYSRQMQAATYNIKGRDNEEVRKAKKAWKKTHELRVASIVSSMARLTDQSSVPPLVLMRSIDNLLTCTPSAGWSRQCREQVCLSRNATEDYLDEVSWWKPMPNYSVSNTYGFVVYDNMEFRQSVEKQRLQNGQLVKTTLMHTTTSTCTPTSTLPYPNLTLT
jgi:hypothetical protein